MSASIQSQLHIPEGINFDCTCCGNCCFQWPVPVTRADFQRINQYAGQQSLDSRKLFRVLNVQDEKLKVFSHSLEKRDDGMCEFLTADKRCMLHEQFGMDSKPAMCRLFPYTFTETPSGTYASVSFASTGVIFNQGKPLSEQEDLLRNRLVLFNELFPNLCLDWEAIQLVDGQPISWNQYLKLEEPLLSRLSDAFRASRVEQALFEEGENFRRKVTGKSNLDNVAGLTTSAKIIDQVLVKNLLSTYFPDDVYHSSTCEIDAQDVARQFLSEPKKVNLRHKGKEVSFQDLVNKRLGKLPEQPADLLRRFAYLRVFSKLYFGPGFNYLSVVAGLHHLALLICLLRIRLKLELISKDADLTELECFSFLSEDARTLERRLTVAAFEKESIAMLEILMLSPNRLARAISLAS